MKENAPLPNPIAPRLHRPFWMLSERYLERMQQHAGNGFFVDIPWLFEIKAGSQGGQLIADKATLNGTEDHVITIDFSRNEMDQLVYLRADKVATDRRTHEELWRSRVVANASEFQVVEFNPISVLRAVRAAATLTLPQTTV